MTQNPPTPAATSYDEMPYINSAFAQTHPDRLATIARLFGVPAPDIETCRVLELGCASGDNLIPMALGLPAARFVGIDLSPRQIDDGVSMVRALGLDNIALRQGDIAGVDASWGTFDYIVCHGIYSWVPEPIREKVLAICSENLAGNGVAFVSYNTYPGWHIRGMIRGMMLYHTAPIAGAQAKVQQSRAILAYLAQNVPAGTPYAQLLQQELEILNHRQDAYLFHDHLEETNHPVYFHEFAAAAQRHGLQYLGEADVGVTQLSRLPPKVAEPLRQLGPDLIRVEQYLDFLRNRMLRQTLLVHRDVPVQRQLDAQALRGFYISSSARPTTSPIALAEGASVTFRAPHGAELSTGSAIAKAALLALAERWPLGASFAELAAGVTVRLQHATGRLADTATAAREEAQLAGALMQCYAGGAVELRTRAPKLVYRPSVRPIASPLARLQAERGRQLTNLRHESVLLDDIDRRVLPLLDGTRDRDAIVVALADMARDGALRVEDGGKVLTGGPLLEAILGKRLEESLVRIALAGLMAA
jgi:methyltransferase-like protein/2-polyprenyl-3-methyl-5-hydroxy-6-metoxy-1,4-benzoquinol methylase